jgi:hypothetical protein
VNTFRSQIGDNTPVAVKYLCSTGSDLDSMEFYFAADRKSVYRIIRTQYLRASDPSIDDVINRAREFYGEPTLYSSGNWLLNYGDAFSIAFPYRNGESEGAAQISANSTGAGLIVKGSSCRYSSTDECPKGKNLAYKIEYELIDQAEAAKQKIEEENRVKNKVKEKLDSQSF